MMSRSRVIKGIRSPRKAYDWIINKYKCKYTTTNIYEEDWEVAIILDGCRYDLIESLEWDLASPLNYIYSVGTYTGEWMDQTFNDYGRDSIYVTAAPFSDLVLDSNEFAELDEVWRYAFDEDVGTIPPRAVTDRAIKYGRQKRESQRLVVHYMQPHFPSLAHPELGSELQPDTDGWPASIWTRLENGEVTEEIVWEAYRSNLEFVIDEVELLLDNVDAKKVLITSDHGNGFGEGGIYGHSNVSDPFNDAIRKVPWIRLTATDNHTYEPKSYDKNNESRNIDDKLEALGYI